MNTYDDAYMRLKKIAIADPLTKRSSYNDYYLIAVFDIRIAISAGGSNGRSWRLLAAAEIYPYTFEGVGRHLGRIFAVTSQGTCFIWLPSYGTGDYGMHKPSFASLTVLHYFAGTRHPPIKIRSPILDVHLHP